MTDLIVQKEVNKISIHDFYFETSLYNPIKIEQLEADILNGEVDAYSRINHIDTTYKIESASGMKINIAGNASNLGMINLLISFLM